MKCHQLCEGIFLMTQCQSILFSDHLYALIFHITITVLHKSPLLNMNKDHIGLPLFIPGIHVVQQVTA